MEEEYKNKEPIFKAPDFITIRQSLMKFIFFPIYVIGKLYRGEYSPSISFFWFCLCGYFQCAFFLFIWGFPLLFFLEELKDFIHLLVTVYFIIATFGTYRSIDKNKKYTEMVVLKKIFLLVFMASVICKNLGISGEISKFFIHLISN